MSSKADARTAIYSRLASAPTFHPATADLFTDWTMQGGDVVIVHSDNVPYSVPVYSMKMKWTGQPKVTVQSSGGETLPSIEAQAQKESSKKGNSYRSKVKTAESDLEIHRAIYSEDGYLHTYIDVTASSIRTEVGTAISGMAQSVIEQTATYIRTEVANAASSISATVIEQTSDYVRTEVASVASGVAWAVVTQTMTNIEQKIGQRARVFVQWEDPSTTHDDLIDGDLWYKKPNATTWNALSGKTWNEIGTYKWKDLYGVVHYVWRNGAWQQVTDTATILENETYIEHDKEHWAVVSKQVDLMGETFNSNLNVTAHKISTEVSAKEAGLYSTIAQTATNITTHVEDVKNGLQSNIEQTASSITLSVSASKSELYSSITQTASQIRLDVASAKSDLSSSIIQTASSIRAEVNAAKSTIYSSITQTASQIRAEVANTASDIRSSITQTASEIRAEVSTAKSSIWSSITQTSTQISLKVGKGEVISSINQTAESITISAQKVNLDGYVKATDLTTTWLSAKIADISSLTGQTFSLDNCYAGTFKFRSSSGSGYSYTDFKDLFVTSINISQSGNTYTLTANNANAQTVSTVTFSRATTLSGAWSSGKFTVSASPQGNSNYTELKSVANADITWNGNTASFEVKAYNNGSETPVSTGKTLSVDASSRYTAGWEDYYDSSYWSSPSVNSSGIVTENGEVKIPKKDGTGNTVWFTISDIHRTRYTLRCTGVEPTYPGSSTKFYYFRLEGSYSFSADTNYYFYR